MDICHLKHAELEPKYQKYNGRVVFRAVIVKNDSGSYAVFTEQGWCPLQRVDVLTSWRARRAQQNASHRRLFQDALRECDHKRCVLSEDVGQVDSYRINAVDLRSRLLAVAHFVVETARGISEENGFDDPLEEDQGIHQWTRRQRRRGGRPHRQRKQPRCRWRSEQPWMWCIGLRKRKMSLQDHLIVQDKQPSLYYTQVRMEDASTTQVAQIMVKHWRFSGSTWTKFVRIPTCWLFVRKTIWESTELRMSVCSSKNKDYSNRYTWMTLK